MIEFRRLLESPARNEVAFVIVGVIAATLRGSARLTFDPDVVYERTPANLERLVAAVLPFTPYLRGAPPGLPFKLTFFIAVGRPPPV